MNLYINEMYAHAAIETPNSILGITSQPAWRKNKNMKEEGIACPSFFDCVCYNRDKRESPLRHATLTNKRAEVSFTLFLLHYS